MTPTLWINFIFFLDMYAVDLWVYFPCWVVDVLCCAPFFISFVVLLLSVCCTFIFCVPVALRAGLGAWLQLPVGCACVPGARAWLCGDRWSQITQVCTGAVTRLAAQTLSSQGGCSFPGAGIIFFHSHRSPAANAGQVPFFFCPLAAWSWWRAGSSDPLLVDQCGVGGDTHTAAVA